VDNFSIRSDYVSRRVAETREPQSEIHDYWTEKRIQEAGYYQYDVYRHAARLLRREGLRSVLDVGAGIPSKVERLIAPITNDITLVDQPPLAPVVDRGFPAYAFLPIDLEQAAEDLGRRYDLVICADVLEHLLDPDPCLSFILRHASPSGRIVVSTPERDIVRGRNCLSSPKPEHVREWTRDEFGRYLTSRGLRVVDHRLLPGRLLAPAERLAWLCLRGALRPKRWAGCQMAVCRLDPAAASRPHIEE
jgi:SAM-dependent methyltransferase